ncbi:polysaccharide deacetylase family protein [Nonomuraea sp. 3N208]|uniref:polysaccharide deacetylase family protein n=1 Tax=Nonomuraea sp. 3N208 TaxID=3457421 RepID=UPI003FD1F80C
MTWWPAVAALLMTTAACGPTTDAADTRTTVHATVAADKTPAIATVSPTWIRGLRVVRDTSNDRRCAWSIAYPQVPGAEPFTAALRRFVEARRSAFLGGAPSDDCAASPDVPGPELNLDFAFLVASGDVIGVRYSQWWLGGAGDGLSTTTRWYDAKTGRDLSASALITPAAIDELGTTSWRSRGSDTRMAAAALRSGDVDDVAFTARGDLVVTFDEGVAGPGAAGQVWIAIPAATARPLLSGFGRRAQRQVMRPDRELRLDGAASPAPTPSGPAHDGAATPTPSVPAQAEGTVVDCHEVRCVALTFDDGPGPYTQTLLDRLADHHARATFFVVGRNVAASPDLVRRTALAGHELGNHSWSHRDLTRLSASQVRDDLRRTDEAIKQASGVAPVIVRPPYGAVNATVRAQTPHPLVLWSVDTLDWKHRDAARVTRAALSAARPGAVMLFHDIHPTTVEAIPRILRTLSARGYHFVTVTQLIGAGLPASRTVFSGATPAP